MPPLAGAEPAYGVAAARRGRGPDLAPADGTVSLGIEVNILPAAIEAALGREGLVIAQINPRMPYTYGDAILPEDYFDYAIEADTPLPSPLSPPASNLSCSIGNASRR